MKENLKLELVLKRPKDKPPFIGVQFEMEYQAGKFNNWYIENKEESTFRGLIIEPKGNVLHLRIEPFFVMGDTYKIETFNALDLQKWLTFATSQKTINFGHVIKKFDEHKVATTANGKLWVLKLNYIEFKQEH